MSVAKRLHPLPREARSSEDTDAASPGTVGDVVSGAREGTPDRRLGMPAPFCEARVRAEGPDGTPDRVFCGLRVVYAVHGHGRGHASRAAAVVPGLLAAGASVELAAPPEVFRVLAAAIDAGARPRHTVSLRRGPLAPVRLLGRALSTARESLRRADLVVSDGDQGALLAARVRRLPSLAIGHDLVFAPGIAPDGLPMAPRFVQQINGLPLLAATRGVAVHFLPMPYPSTVPPRNTGHGLGAWMRRRIRLARPDLADLPPAATAADGPIVAYGEAAAVEPVLDALERLGEPVIAFGIPGPERRRLVRRPIERASFVSALAAASAVVSTFGSNVIAECVALGKPLVGVLVAGHDEQRLNAALCVRASIAVVLTSANDAHVARALERARGGALRRIDLRACLPPLSRVALEEIKWLASTTS
jgi:UDP:flavonoid glycosyltransferase YjiC (YdhE family)